MANGDILRQLFQSHTQGDDASFRAAAEAIIHEERAKNHRLLADDLQRLLIRGGKERDLNELRRPTVVASLPHDRERGFALVDIEHFDLPWERLVVHPSLCEALQAIAEENRRADVLATAGLRPTSKALFYGPPGCGKTLAARVLASILDRPLVTVRFDAVVSSYLGETASNLRRVFDFIGREHAVVLFDEFDAIGKDRDNTLEHGELKRVVNSLLQLMDAYRGDSLLIAATNHEGLLDDAIWRRFDAVLEFARPTHQERVLLLRNFFRGFRLQFDPANLARALSGATGADIERLAIDAARRAVLDGRSTVTTGDVATGIKAFRGRYRASNKQSSAKRLAEDAIDTQGQ